MKCQLGERCESEFVLMNFITELELYRRKKVDVKANFGSSVSFMIIPKQLGYITIRATANSVLAGDSVEHKLLVNVSISS